MTKITLMAKNLGSIRPKMKQVKAPGLCSKFHLHVVSLRASSCPHFWSNWAQILAIRIFFITLGVKNEFQPNLNFMPYPTLHVLFFLRFLCLLRMPQNQYILQGMFYIEAWAWNAWKTGTYYLNDFTYNHQSVKNHGFICLKAEIFFKLNKALSL